MKNNEKKMDKFEKRDVDEEGYFVQCMAPKLKNAKEG